MILIFVPIQTAQTVQKMRIITYILSEMFKMFYHSQFISKKIINKTFHLKITKYMERKKD